MARPDDWLDPMHTPAIAAAYQKPPLVVVTAAMMQVAIQLLHLVHVLAIGRGSLRRLEKLGSLFQWMGDGPTAKFQLIHGYVLFVVSLTPWPL